jgi:catechol 2,3-dioxygenase-like lactoylglutathione lyase family enzyme
MSIELFAGLPVSDFAASLTWYERLLGSPPSFFPHETEAVWEIAEHRWVYIVQRPGQAGHGLVTILIDDFDSRIAGIAERGIEPTAEETYDNGVRKTIYHDPDGNEIGFGSVPA